MYEPVQGRLGGSAEAGWCASLSKSCITLCKWEVKLTIALDKAMMLKDGLRFYNTNVRT